MDLHPPLDLWYVFMQTGNPVRWDTTYTGNFEKVAERLNKEGFQTCVVPHGSPPPPLPWPTSNSNSPASTDTSST